MLKPHPDLKDKKWKGCVFLQPDWGNKVLKAVVDPKCPDKEPIIETPSSCTTQEELDEIKAKKKRKRKPAPCLSGKLRPNHPMCRDDEDKILSPMDMD